jgi:hypothetical protein
MVRKLLWDCMRTQRPLGMAVLLAAQGKGTDADFMCINVHRKQHNHIREKK